MLFTQSSATSIEHTLSLSRISSAMAPPTAIAIPLVYFSCIPNLNTIADVGPAMGPDTKKQKTKSRKQRQPQLQTQRHIRRGLGQPQIIYSVRLHALRFCIRVFLSFFILVVASIGYGSHCDVRGMLWTYV